MSKKSTARTGSEGDADSTTFTDVFANIRPDSSSCQTKRDIEGGPFGDSPCENTQQMLKDCFILMFRDDDTSTEASESSEMDQELYNLQNDYLEKLNAVRRTLNLLEIADEEGNLSSNRCTITEIVDEDTSNGSSAKINQEDCKEKPVEEELTWELKDKTEETGTDDLVTIFAPVKCYKFEPASTASLFELNYNPPKKKLCYRQRTPRPTSVSEGNLPYYTRVGLHDDLFGPNKNLVNKDLMWGCGNGNNKSFIETKETQCTDEDFSIINKAKSKEEVFIFGQQNVNLFPEVIIDNATKNACESSSSSSVASIKSKPIKKCTKKKIKASVGTIGLSLNTAEYISDDSFTTTTYSTTIDSPERNKTVRKRFGRRPRVSSTEKLTLWEEIRRLHSSSELKNTEQTTGGASPESKVEKLVDKDVKVKQGNVYIKHYLRYKKEVDEPRSWSIPFGTTVADRHAEFLGSVEYLRPSASSSVSGEDKKTKDAVAREGSGISRAKFLLRSCFCCWMEDD